jgi:hypothetical protein
LQSTNVPHSSASDYHSAPFSLRFHASRATILFLAAKSRYGKKPEKNHRAQAYSGVDGWISAQ